MNQPIRILDTGTRPPSRVPRGVDLRHQPALVREPLDLMLDELELLDETSCHLVFYSRFSVRCVADQLESVDDHQCWAVGPKTASLIGERLGAEARVPDEQRFSGLKQLLRDRGRPRPIVAFGLRGKDRDLGPVADDWNTTFESIDVYQSNFAPSQKLREALDEHRPDWLTVTSSRGVRSLVEAVGRSRLEELQTDAELSIAAIGPSTASTLTEFGLSADAIPENPGREALLEKIIDG